MIAIKQANTEFNPQEQLLKRKHLQDSAQLISKNAFPSLSTYFTLISRQQQQQQQQAQTTSNQATLTHRHQHHHEFIHTRIRWCDKCLASCSIRVKMKTHQVLLTCQRSTCRKRFIQPLSAWSRADQQPSENLIKEQPPPTTKKLKTEAETSDPPQPTTGKTGNTTSLEKTKSSSSKKSKNRPSRSALNDLLARRKQADEQASSKNNLHNFLTQL